MLKASREAVPEGKPLDPTLLHDGFLRVNNKKKKHIQKLNPKLCLRVYFCLELFHRDCDLTRSVLRDVVYDYAIKICLEQTHLINSLSENGCSKKIIIYICYHCNA